jgi:O-antigen ligase
VAEPRSARAAAPAAFVALALILAALAVLAPPEIHPWSQAGVQALAAGILLVAAFGRPPVPLRPPAWLALAAALALPPVLAAACRARAVDEAVYAVVLVIAGLAGRAVAGRRQGAALLGAVLAALAVTAAAHAAFQRFVTYPALAASLLARDPADPTGILVRLQSGRPSGPLLLPAALGGFLALALPWTVMRAARGPDPRVRVLAGAAAAAIGTGLLLTRSIGALAAAAAGLLVIVPVVAARRRRVAAAAVGAFLLAGAFVFVLQRADVRPASGADPLTLRAGNWRAAVRMIAERPVLGVGPGSFAAFYPRHLRAGMNEARHAHNSWLETAAGWGLWSLAPLALLAHAWARNVRARVTAAAGPGSARRTPDDRLALLAGGGAFLAHNLVDFTAFLPGVAVPAALALGGGLETGGAAAPESRSRRAGWRGAAARAAVAALAVALAAHGAATSHARALLEEARAAAGRGDAGAAIALARRSRDARPDHPDARAFLAQAILVERRDDRDLFAEGEREAAAAVRLDPESAVLHWTRSLYHEVAGEPAAARRERAAARRLYPLKDLYREPDAAAGRGR